MIRRAKVGDAEAVHAVLLTARNDIPLASNFADERHKKWVRDECRHRRVWMLERDGVLAGVMVMSVDEIFYLVTVAAHRKTGVAQALGEDAKSRVWKKYREPARGRARLENLPVVRLLEKLDFFADHNSVTQPGWICYRAKPPT